MKIIYISYSTIPSRTANSIHVMKMCSALSNLGHDVTLYAPDGVDEIESEVDNFYDYYGVNNSFKIKKIKLPNNRFSSKLYALSLCFRLILEKPDLVFGRYLLGCAISTSLGIKTIFETHLPFNELSANDQYLLKKALNKKSFKRLIVISEAMRGMYIKDNIISKPAILQVAHDGADIYNDTQVKIPLLGEADKLKLGYIGHLYAGRGIELLIELAVQSVNVEFHIVGGKEEDINYWKKIVGKKKITNFFFYGHVSPSETVAYRASFDILLAPYSTKVTVSGNKGDTSKYMSPLKIFEYMAHKKAILCSDLPVLREVLNDDNSILVKADDTQSWLAGIEQLKSKALRDKVANAAHEDFMSKYTWIKRAEYIIGNLNEQ